LCSTSSAFGDLFKFFIELGPVGFVELQLGLAALIVDGDRSPVFHRPFNVVNADVVTENGASILVCKLNWCTGKSNERRIRQRLAHMPGIAVDEVILAAVGFVGDDHDIPLVRE
jgi:hypothetical protein